MSTDPAPFPLAWPAGIPRHNRRTASAFKTSLSGALANVRKSLELFGRDTGVTVKGIVLSSNAGGLELGTPRDPAVAAWFSWDGEMRCVAVDRYDKVEDNLQAIHHILEARRTEMRHGGLNIVKQTFKSFVALPAPPGSTWREVLGFTPADPVNREEVDARYRSLAERQHPDKPGGSAEKMSALNRARDDAKRELSS